MPEKDESGVDGYTEEHHSKILELFAQLGLPSASSSARDFNGLTSNWEKNKSDTENKESLINFVRENIIFNLIKIEDLDEETDTALNNLLTDLGMDRLLRE